MKRKIMIVMLVVAAVLALATGLKADDAASPSVASLVSPTVTKGDTAVVQVDLSMIGYDSYTIEVSANMAGTADLTDLVTDATGTDIKLAVERSVLKAAVLLVSYPISTDADQGQLAVTVMVHQVVDPDSGAQAAADTVQYLAVTILDRTPSSSGTGTSGQTTPSSANGAKGASAVNQQLVYNGSSDNYLRSLAVSGYDLLPEFNNTCTTYFITVGASVTKLSVTAVCAASASTVIYQPAPLATGANKILVTVTAADGSRRIYRIIVTKEG